MTPDELSERLINFAARVGKVVDALPNTRMGVTSRDSLFAVAPRRHLTMRKLALPRVGLTSSINSAYA
jgi:hypothetical protein